MLFVGVGFALRRGGWKVGHLLDEPQSETLNLRMGSLLKYLSWEDELLENQPDAEIARESYIFGRLKAVLTAV